MANEITIQSSISCANGNFKLTLNNGQFRVNQSVAGGGSPGTVTVAFASATTISLADMTKPGFVWIKNLDATNYVTYGPDSGGSMVGFGELKAGEETILRLSRTTPTVKMQANTAACEVQIHAFED